MYAWQPPTASRVCFPVQLFTSVHSHFFLLISTPNLELWEVSCCSVFQASSLPYVNRENRLNIILLSMYPVYLLELQMIQHLGSAGKSKSWPGGLANLSTVVYDPASLSERRPIMRAKERATRSAPVNSNSVHYTSLNPQQRWVWSATPDWVAVAEVQFIPSAGSDTGRSQWIARWKRSGNILHDRSYFLTCTLGRETQEKRCIVQWWKCKVNVNRIS